MKYVMASLMIMFCLTGCGWVESHQIKKAVKDFYNRPVCLDFQKVKTNPYVIKSLIETNILEAHVLRNPAGVMGYVLESSYDLTPIGRQILNDKKQLCYGKQFVDDIKGINFDHKTQAVVSFVVKSQINQEWAHAPFFQKKIAQSKQLRRAFVHKKLEGGWSVRPSFIPSQNSQEKAE